MKNHAHPCNQYSCRRPGCNSSFGTNTDLVRHEQVHLNKVHHCLFCPYVNARQSMVIYHQRVHFNTRDYECDICGGKFTNQKTLNSHLTRQHMSETTQCPLCGREGERKAVNDHLNKHHKVKGVGRDRSFACIT